MWYLYGVPLVSEESYLDLEFMLMLEKARSEGGGMCLTAAG